MKKFLLTSTAVLAFASVSSAAYIIDNFDSYTTGDWMFDDGWAVQNDGGAPHPATIVDTYFDGNNANLQGSLGGYPGATVPSTTGTAKDSTGGGISLVSSPHPTTFQITAAIVDTVTGQDAREQFAFRLVDTFSGTDLFALTFTPVNATPTDADAETGQWTVAWESDLGTGFDLGVMNEYYVDGFGVPQNVSTFQVVFGQGTGTNVNFQITNGVNIWNGVLDGTDANTYDIDRFSAQVVQGTTESANYIVFDNVSVIPEPSSLALLGLGAIAGLRRRRQA